MYSAPLELNWREAKAAKLLRVKNKKNKEIATHWEWLWLSSKMTLSRASLHDIKLRMIGSLATINGDHLSSHRQLMSFLRF